jgi:predicted aminopeptidase
VRRRFRGSIGRGLLLSAVVSTSLTCSPAYVIRAGLTESRILGRRRPIAEVAIDPATPVSIREKLDLVVQARDFAVRVLHLEAGKSYTTYSHVDRDTLLLVVSAARKDRFEPYTWWFPIVGRVPYKGFFDFDAARREADHLADRGFDTYVRPSPAFSTLGFFNDPLLNTALRTTDVGIVSTVIHELLHNTIFIASRIDFNESFASFVGDRGAIDFFCARDGATSTTCREATEEWQDNLVFGEFLTDLVDRLEKLYARTDLDTAEIIRLREAVFDDAKQRFQSEVQPRLHRSYRNFTRQPLNNATLIGIRLYYRRLDLFEAVYRASGSNLLQSIDRIRAATHNANDPFAAVAATLTAPHPPHPDLPALHPPALHPRRPSPAIRPPPFVSRRPSPAVRLPI